VTNKAKGLSYFHPLGKNVTDVTVSYSVLGTYIAVDKFFTMIQNTCRDLFKRLWILTLPCEYICAPVRGRGGLGLRGIENPHFLDSRLTHGGEAVSFTCWLCFYSFPSPAEP
jgi:hypothetical protein